MNNYGFPLHVSHILPPPKVQQIKRTETYASTNIATINGDSILPHIATFKSVATHSGNPDTPITLCVAHRNQFICPHCDKFFEVK
jgi:hypothetical protein